MQAKLELPEGPLRFGYCCCHSCLWLTKKAAQWRKVHEMATRSVSVPLLSWSGFAAEEAGVQFLLQRRGHTCVAPPIFGDSIPIRWNGALHLQLVVHGEGESTEAREHAAYLEVEGLHAKQKVEQQANRLWEARLKKEERQFLEKLNGLD